MSAVLGLSALVGLAGVLVADVVGVFRSQRLGGWLRLVLALLLGMLLVVRSMQIGFIAIFSQYDSLVLFAALILCVVGWLQIRSHQPEPAGRDTTLLVLGSTLLALVLLALASSPLIPPGGATVMPALRSIWLPLHVGLAFVGEAFFTVAFIGSIIWLVRHGRTQTASAAAQRLDRLVYRSIAVGYGLFTVGGLIFGAIWAHQAWGRYWGWDPKETWALVTFIVYSLYLHARLRRWGRGRIGHWISVLGYASAMFTLFGVNLIYQSLHAY